MGHSRRRTIERCLFTLLVVVSACGAEPEQKQESKAPAGFSAPREKDSPPQHPSPASPLPPRDQAQASAGEPIESAMYPNKDLPADFPKDVPVMPDFQAVQSQTVAEAQAFSITGQTSQSTGEVFGYYQKEAAAQGWQEVQAQTAAEDMRMLIYAKEGRMLSVTIMAGQQGGTVVTVSTAVRQ